MSILATFQKQPADVQDYDINFTPYLDSQYDTAHSHEVTADSGITITSSLSYGVVKVWVSGGQDGQTYKISATLTTTEGRVKQGDIAIVVKED